MLRLAACYSIAFALLGLSFYIAATHSPPAEPAPLDYEAIGFCFWDRYDPAGLVSEMVRDVRFCIEVYPHSQP